MSKIYFYGAIAPNTERDLFSLCKEGLKKELNAFMSILPFNPENIESGFYNAFGCSILSIEESAFVEEEFGRTVLWIEKEMTQSEFISEVLSHAIGNKILQILDFKIGIKCLKS